MSIDRPATAYDDPTHSYTLDGEKLLGVSTVAKIGGAESTWSVASAWGFRVGYEGAYSLGINYPTADDLRAELQKRGLTPWSTRDKAGDRGSWVHDILEALAQDSTIPTEIKLREFSDEARGHARGLLAWYIKYRPTFVATEVQVTSRTHKFAGRYDIRCTIPAWRIVALFDGHASDQAKRVRELGEASDVLCLIDLKTSKGVYPTTHMPQLAGYEGASIEMGFPPTDAQFVLNTHPDGTYDLVPSWATFEDFLAYLEALKAIRRIEANDPATLVKGVREDAILLALPSRSRQLADTLPELAGLTGRSVGILMSGLRKRGLVVQNGSVWSVVAS